MYEKNCTFAPSKPHNKNCDETNLSASGNGNRDYVDGIERLHHNQRRKRQLHANRRHLGFTLLTDRIMKKVLIAFAALLLAAVGCEKNNGNIISDANGITTIQAVISDLDDSRAHIDGAAYKQVWEEGDEISVFDGISNVKFTLTAGAGTAIGSFSAEASLATADYYYAAYPYSAETTMIGDSLCVVFPTEPSLKMIRLSCCLPKPVMRSSVELAS